MTTHSGAQWSLITRMTPVRKMVLVALCCAAAAWFAGPVGRLPVVLLLLLFGPGYLLERALSDSTPKQLFVRPALWLALSLALIALLYTWTTALGLPLTLPVLYLLAALTGVGVLWRVWQAGDTVGPVRLPQIERSGTLLAAGVLLLVLVLTLATRFYQIRDLALPAWVDSVHHAVLTRVITEQGLAPYSLRPYLPIDTLPYHWGYHTVLASVVQLAGLDIPNTMLWSGQVLNSLHVLTCAALASYFWRRPFAGVVAGVVVGLISIMPAYYVSWGRYTHLTGLLMLPALAISWQHWLRTLSWRSGLLTMLLLAGLSVVHMIVLFLALTLLASSGLVWLLRAPRAAIWSRVWQSALLAGGALLLAAPWLWSLLFSRIAPAVENPQTVMGGGNYSTFKPGLLWVGETRLLVALALAGALGALARRSPVVPLLLGWVGLMFVGANPWLLGYLLLLLGVLTGIWMVRQSRLLVRIGGALLMTGALIGLSYGVVHPETVHLPYFAMLTNDAILISLFLPLSVLIGGGACLGYSWLKRFFARRPGAIPYVAANVLGLLALWSLWHTRDTLELLPVLAALAAALVLALVLVVGFQLRHRFQGGIAAVAASAIASSLLVLTLVWGTWNSRDVINWSTVFATQADHDAIEWVAANTSPDARFLINATAWYPHVDRGTDGGWWLLPLTGRWTTVPPAIHDYGPADYVQAVRGITRQIATFEPDQRQQLFDLIEREQITHIYLGQNAAPITPAVFADNPTFEQVYAQQGVTIFAVREPLSQ